MTLDEFELIVAEAAATCEGCGERGLAESLRSGLTDVRGWHERATVSAAPLSRQDYLDRLDVGATEALRSAFSSAFPEPHSGWWCRAERSISAGGVVCRGGAYGREVGHIVSTRELVDSRAFDPIRHAAATMVDRLLRDLREDRLVPTPDARRLDEALDRSAELAARTRAEPGVPRVVSLFPPRVDP